MNRIAVSYSGVHQAFQTALAASELGELDRFYCSIFDAPGKWGGRTARLPGPSAVLSRRCAGIDPNRVTENPWPLLRHRARAVFNPRFANDWFAANEAFDRWAAGQLRKSPAQIFVGTETCAKYCFEVAKQKGMIRLLDAPALHPAFRERILAQAAADTGISMSSRLDTPAMAERKQCEFTSADLLLVYSEVHQRSFADAGFKRFFKCPLWVDGRLWFPEACLRDRAEPLRVLFVGGISMNKGVPYLLRAAQLCGSAIKLSLLGVIAPELEKLVQRCASLFDLFAPQPKTALRTKYCQHDILVLPSLADSFGFVALEAMACGLPVIVSENCGVPVPDERWRVPVMSAEAIAERLLLYAGDRKLCREHGRVAKHFAAAFTPEGYRAQMKQLFKRLLNGNSAPGDPSPLLHPATSATLDA